MRHSRLPVRPGLATTDNSKSSLRIQSLSWLSWLGIILRWYGATRPKMVTRRSTNPAQRRVSWSFVRRTTPPLRQTANRDETSEMRRLIDVQVSWWRAARVRPSLPSASWSTTMTARSHWTWSPPSQDDTCCRYSTTDSTRQVTPPA